MSKSPTFPISLFYSYSHKDSSFRERMEKTLKLLEENAGLKQWSDRSICPGEHLSDAIKQNMEKSDILVFLISSDFLASEACKEEWSYAGQLALNGNKIRIPIVLKECAWQDYDDMKSVLALPQDGKPVTRFSDKDAAWLQIYEGIKNVIESLRNCFSVKKEFVDEITKIDFISQQKQDIRLSDLFVFPSLYFNADEKVTFVVDNVNQIIEKKYALIDGDDLSGKTALCFHLFLTLVKEEKPVLFIDLKDITNKKPSMKIYQEMYSKQFRGDFSLWKKQEDITVILDNLSQSSDSMAHVIFAKDNFQNIVVTVASDIYRAYWHDDSRLANFASIKIDRLSHTKQEKLIRKWTELSNQSVSITDGRIDQIEDKINSVIINNRIVPRYPFYVLSILQLNEGFMPNDLKITAHGHCYYAMILAHLLKSGINKEDSDINSCINFASHLAFHIYKEAHNASPVGEQEFNNFTERYKKKFVIKDSTIKRLQSQDYGIIKDRKFRNPYMYYYFLGKYLSDHSDANRNIIESMADKSYVRTNCLALIFIIHHSQDNDLIDDLVLRTMCSLDGVPPSTLSPEETKVFQSLLNGIPGDISSDNNVAEERQKEREARDLTDQENPGADEDGEIDHKGMNEVYRILKNNEILGQILRNKYGSLTRDKIMEIIETVADGGLRIIKLGLMDQRQVNEIANFECRKHPEHDLGKIKNAVQFFMFFWTVINIEKIAHDINKPEIRSVIEEIVHDKATPAYKLIGYFTLLDSVEKFGENENRHLGELLTAHKEDSAIKTIVSLRTQIYMNTHEMKEQIAQSVSSKLGIRFRRRLPH